MREYVFVFCLSSDESVSTCVVDGLSFDSLRTVFKKSGVSYFFKELVKSDSDKEEVI